MNNYTYLLVMITAIGMSSSSSSSQLITRRNYCDLADRQLNSSIPFSIGTVDISAGCYDALYQLSSLGASDSSLLFRYWDSWGKVPLSIARMYQQETGAADSRNIATYLGYYDQCIDLKETALGEMRYCLFPMSMQHTPRGAVEQFNMGICYPATCSVDEFVAAVLSQGVSITDDCMTIMYDKDPNRSISCPIVDANYDIVTKLVIFTCIVLVSLVLIGSQVAYWTTFK